MLLHYTLNMKRWRKKWLHVSEFLGGAEKKFLGGAGSLRMPWLSHYITQKWIYVSRFSRGLSESFLGLANFYGRLTFYGGWKLEATMYLMALFKVFYCCLSTFMIFTVRFCIKWNLLRRTSHKTDTSLRRTLPYVTAERRCVSHRKTCIRRTIVRQTPL